jgi:hypothetical protein
MSLKVSSGVNLTIDGLGLLVSVAEAVPVLGAPVKGSFEALKQILQYAQVRAFPRGYSQARDRLCLVESQR